MESGHTHPLAIVEEAIESICVGPGRRSGTTSRRLAGSTGCSEHEATGFGYLRIGDGIAMKGIGSASNRLPSFANFLIVQTKWDEGIGCIVPATLPGWNKGRDALQTEGGWGCAVDTADQRH